MGVSKNNKNHVPLPSLQSMKEVFDTALQKRWLLK
jgi:hypothetical protein